jgi:hypothetical protein
MCVTRILKKQARVEGKTKTVQHLEFHPQKRNEKVDGKNEGLQNFVCVRFSGLCSA